MPGFPVKTRPIHVFSARRIPAFRLPEDALAGFRAHAQPPFGRAVIEDGCRQSTTGCGALSDEKRVYRIVQRFDKQAVMDGIHPFRQTGILTGFLSVQIAPGACVAGQQCGHAHFQTGTAAHLLGSGRQRPAGYQTAAVFHKPFHLGVKLLILHHADPR